MNNDNGENITSKQIWVGILFIALITGGMIIADLVMRYTKKETTTPQPVVTEGKEIKLPSEPQQKEDIYTKYNSTVLLSEAFFPPQSIYTDSNTYNEHLINVALIGEFDKVALKVTGQITNDLDNFLSINIDGISGVLGGYRKTVNTLDLDKTTGVFNKENPIDFSLDLREPIKLSTTKEEFLSTFDSTKNVVIWDKIKPPSYTGKGTIAKLLIAPYNEEGKYGDGVSINNIELFYTCKGKANSCKASVCDKNKNYTYGSECLRDNFEKDFGKKSWESYADYFRQ